LADAEANRINKGDMEFHQTVEQRYSARAYRDTPVPAADLKFILEAANAAPSAGNLQAYEIVVVRDAAAKERLARISFQQMFIAQAPVVLGFFANPDRNREKYGERGGELYALEDATIACAYAQLAATDRGLATCWIGAFDEKQIQEVVEVPAHWRPVALLPLGTAADQPEPRERRAVADLVRGEVLP
jgi:nitroreductase